MEGLCHKTRFKCANLDPVCDWLYIGHEAVEAGHARIKVALVVKFGCLSCPNPLLVS